MGMKRVKNTPVVGHDVSLPFQNCGMRLMKTKDGKKK